MAVSKRLRYEVMRRDNHACRYCGATAPDVDLTIDHVVPVTLGGSDEPSNLVTACRDCNAGKSSASADHSLVADVSSDALRWAAAIKLATEQAMAARERQLPIEKSILDEFDDVLVPSYHGGGTAAQYLPGDWFESIAQFMAAGLDPREIKDAAQIATGAYGVKPQGMWRYFCGVCWKKIERRQQAARELLDAETPEPEPLRAAYESEKRYALHVYSRLSAACEGITGRAG